MKTMRFACLFGLFALGLSALISAPAHAAVFTQVVEYEEGGTALEGYLAYDDASQEKRPGVLVFHEWKGLGPYAMKRAEQLAQLGYVAFAADVYGKGVRPKTNEEAGRTAGIYKKDRALLRRRAQAALDVLAGHPFADPKRLAAIGYCFGGTAALELGRGGADLQGIVSFHGGLSTPNPADAARIKAAVLILHGAADPHVPPAEVEAFRKEMDDAGVRWELVAYEGAVHSFTNPEAGNDPSKGSAYDEEADIKSWMAMRRFFEKIF
jgi:dienelactone hydrolase